jgi:tetratricopeptide (TPR) repeat protein
VLSHNFLGYLARSRGDFAAAYREYLKGLSDYPAANIEKLLISNSLDELNLLSNRLDGPRPELDSVPINSVNYVLYQTLTCRQLYLRALIAWRKGDLAARDLSLRAIQERYVYQPYVVLAKGHLGQMSDQDVLQQLSRYNFTYRNDILFGLGEEHYRQRDYGQALQYYRDAVAASNRAIDIVDAPGYTLEYEDIFFLLARQRMAELERKGIK